MSVESQESDQRSLEQSIDEARQATKDAGHYRSGPLMGSEDYRGRIEEEFMAEPDYDGFSPSLAIEKNGDNQELYAGNAKVSKTGTVMNYEVVADNGQPRAEKLSPPPASIKDMRPGVVYKEKQEPGVSIHRRDANGQEYVETFSDPQTIKKFGRLIADQVTRRAKAAGPSEQKAA
jgi:hypothetical protein